MKREAECLGGILIRKKAKRLLAIVLAGLMVNSVIGYGGIVNAEEVGGITVDTQHKSIYANGEAIIIADKDGDIATTTDTLIYLDFNESGAIDSGENPVTLNDVSGSTAEGYDLQLYAILGGSQSASVPTTKVTVQGGQVQSIYGGGAAGSRSENTNVTINGGTIQNRLYGGGKLDSATGSTNVTMNGGAVWGNIFGGGEDNLYNNDDNTLTGTTNVIINGGSTTKIYGGAYGGTVEGDTNVTVSGGEFFGIYGVGEYGIVTGNANVTIDGGTINNKVYGGGYMSAVGGNINVTVRGGTIKESLYGGGEHGNVVGDIHVTIDGGTIENEIYGDGFDCSVGGSTNVTINGGTVSSVRSGSYKDKVFGNRTVTINGGTINGAVALTDTIRMGVDAPAELQTDHYDFLQYEVAFYDGTAKFANPEPQWITAETISYQQTGNTAAKPGIILKKEGKIFDGWKTADNSSYDFTQPVTEATKLYAVWVDAPTYAVTYNGNGNTGGSVPVEGKTYYDGANVSLAGNTGNLTKTGYTFIGWSTTLNGEAITSYTMSAEPVTFYAVWKSVPTNNNGGSSSSGGSSSGGGSPSGSNTPATPVSPASPTSPAAVKQAEAAIAGLTTTQKQETSKNLQEYLPYTCLAAKELTLEQLQKLTNNQLTKETMETIIQKPELLKALGIDVTALSTQVLLKPVQHPEFKDVAPSHWASDTIQKAAQLGLAAGSPDGTFAPSAPLQVADTFTFLDRVLLLNNITASTLPRSTVEKYITAKDHWAFNHMASIGSRLSEQTLKTISELGDKPLTRELLAQTIYEITQAKIKATKEVPIFADTQSSPYKDAINYCVSVGLLNGIDSSHMAPTKALTRAELMSVLIRLNDKLK